MVKSKINGSMHLKDIYDSKELDEKATSKDFLLVQKYKVLIDNLQIYQWQLIYKIRR